VVLNSIIDYAELNDEDKIEGGAIFVDWSKAFDSITHDWITKILTKAKIPPEFIKWVSLLYTNPLAAVIINGKCGKKNRVGRGVRQGCPLSPLLFALCVEPLACAIRQNEAITGLYIKSLTDKTPVKISLFADDTTLFLKNKNEIDIAFTIINEFGLASGMQLNETKTIGLWLGNKECKPPTHCNSSINWMQWGQVTRVLG
jgi:hypothetical protein